MLNNSKGFTPNFIENEGKKWKSSIMIHVIFQNYKNGATGKFQAANHKIEIYPNLLR